MSSISSSSMSTTSVMSSSSVSSFPALPAIMDKDLTADYKNAYDAALKALNHLQAIRSGLSSVSTPTSTSSNFSALTSTSLSSSSLTSTSTSLRSSSLTSTSTALSSSSLTSASTSLSSSSSLTSTSTSSNSAPISNFLRSYPKAPKIPNFFLAKPVWDMTIPVYQAVWLKSVKEPYIKVGVILRDAIAGMLESDKINIKFGGQPVDFDSEARGIYLKIPTTLLSTEGALKMRTMLLEKLKGVESSKEIITSVCIFSNRIFYLIEIEAKTTRYVLPKCFLWFRINLTDELSDSDNDGDSGSDSDSDEYIAAAASSATTTRTPVTTTTTSTASISQPPLPSTSSSSSSEVNSRKRRLDDGTLSNHEKMQRTETDS